ncbi:MAG: sigma-70 family RNA polymerase sigma factor, partial [Hamadaea sp.]|nr:sigma-70 family RNA polymerase sigma factor [Hamadaea sp.]
MAFTPADTTQLVVAAQEGDGRARAALIGGHLPLLYNIVGRALGGHSDVDDVVQETLLRAVRDLRTLRDPASFRSWLVAIAVRQIGAHRSRQRAHTARESAFDETVELPVTGAGFEEAALLRMGISAQRREVAQASRWLDPPFRTLFSLWWQENAGWLSRAEVAAAAGMTVAHTGVRLQRMREQLDLARAIVAALNGQPRCTGLAGVVARWEGDRTPLWRKRIGRHVRECPVCTGAAAGRLALERLLLGLAPLAVPAGLVAALTAEGLLPGYAGSAAAGAGIAGGLQVTLLGKLAQALAAHPLATLATGAALAAGTAVTYVNWPAP